MQIIKGLIALMMLLFSSLVLSMPNYDVSHLEKTRLVNNYWQLSTNTFSAKRSAKTALVQLLNLQEDQWQSVQKNRFNVTATPIGNWFAVELSNSLAHEKSIYLSVLNNPLVVKMQLYSRSLATSQGHDVAMKQTPQEQMLTLNSNDLRFSHITLKAHEKIKLYLYIVAEHKLNLTVKLSDEASFLKASRDQQFNSGIAIGGIVCLALIELLWFFASGLKSALLLTGYFVSRAMLLAALLGWSLFYLLPDMPELRGVGLPLLAALSSIFFLWFIIELFDLNHGHSKLTRIIRYFCWLVLAYIPLSLLLTVTQNIFISFAIHLLTTLLLVIIASCLLKKQNRLAGLFTVIAVLQLIFLLAVMATSLWLGLELDQYRANILHVDFWLNGLLISFLLSRQFYFESKDKELAQRQALDHAISSKNSQNELIALQNENQEILEQHVQERTLELNIALQELGEANQELARKNTLDELTGLNNRRFYDQKILAEFRRSKRNLTSLSLVLIDIDHFKKVNDTYGHQAGDQCLQQIAEKIKASLKRSTDIGCRYGGEEFCLILPNTDTLGAIELAENLRQRVSQTQCEFDDVSLQVTISCGVSTYKQQADVNPEQIFAAADKALYQAKHNGRNQTWQYAIEDL